MNQKSITDYIITKQASGHKVNYVRVKRGAECGSNHFLLSAQVLAKQSYKAKMRIEYGQQSKKGKEKKYKIDLLQQDSIRMLYQNRARNLLESIDTDS
jgi:hypothetical protein